MSNLLKAIKAFLIDYRQRHLNSIDLVLHVMGVPLAFYGFYLIFTMRWRDGLLNVFIGYLLQWIGHTFYEKNEVGEWILIKKIAGRLVRER